MNRLNRKVEYALIALKHMSGKFAGRLTTVKEICAATGIPFDATSRVMQQLNQRGILKAEHGAQGGYMIVSDLSKVSFYDVVHAISGPVEVVRCVSSDEDCEFSSSCNVATPLQNFNQKLIGFYKSLSVADILEARHAREEAL